MNSPRNSTSRISPRTVLVIVLLLLVCGGVPPVRHGFATLMTPLVSPVWRASTFLSGFITRPFAYLAAQERLLQENAVLNNRVRIAEEREAIARALRQENQELMLQAGRTPDSRRDTTTAPALPFFFGKDPHVAVITSRPVRSYYDTLIIDRGRADGIVVGNTVFSSGGILLGAIDATFAHQSRVVLYSSSGTKTSVLIGKDHLATVAEGQGGGNFVVRVAHGAPIAVGDTVEVPHDEPWVLGVVGALDAKPSQALASVLIKSSVNFQEMKWVVVTNTFLVPELPAHE